MHNLYSIGIIYLLLSIILFLLAKFLNINTSFYKQIGFLRITPLIKNKFFPISKNIINIKPVVNALSDKNVKIFSSLEKVFLLHKEKNVILEEKNYKVSLLVNRHRMRYITLRHGDIIDIGNLTLMFINPNQRIRTQNHSLSIKTTSKHISSETAKQKNRFSFLTPKNNKQSPIYLTKNITFIGKSNTNDLVIKSTNTALRHAKIEKINKTYKITDLSSNGIYINGNRINTHILKHNDMLSFDANKYKFISISSVNSKT